MGGQKGSGPDGREPDARALGEEMAEVRQRLRDNDAFLLVVAAAPHAGKTSVVLATIDALRDELNIAVVGDATSAIDEERLRAQGIPAVSVGEGAALGQALDQLDLARLDLVIVESGSRALDETLDSCAQGAAAPWARVAVFSVAEGVQAPVSWGDALGSVAAVVLNKVDRAKREGFDLSAFEAAVESVSPHTPVFALSATSGFGVAPWASFLSDLVEGA